MGDPVGAAQHILQSLSKDGTWMIVEPFANDDLKDNLNPVGRVYYSFSTLLSYALFTLAGSRPLSGSASWRSSHARSRQLCWFHPLPQIRGNSVQHGL